MNNKGFAITTILFGTMILFCLLLVSLLGILAAYKNNMEKLVNSDNGARAKAIMKPDKTYSSYDELKCASGVQRGLYCFSDGTCQYVSNTTLKAAAKSCG